MSKDAAGRWKAGFSQPSAVFGSRDRNRSMAERVGGGRTADRVAELPSRVRRTPVPGEAAYDAESCRPFSRLLVGVLGRPLQRQADRDVRTAFSCQERRELLQPSLMPNQLEPQAATQSQVVADTFGQPIHREPPG